MPESSLHILLVKRMYVNVMAQFFEGDDGSIFADMPETPRTSKPRRIGDFYPDIYARCLMSGAKLIGEAKTGDDLERKHSMAQFEAYINHLNSNLSRSILVIAVPIYYRARAKNILVKLRRELKAETVELYVWGF